MHLDCISLIILNVDRGIAKLHFSRDKEKNCVRVSKPGITGLSMSLILLLNNPGRLLAAVKSGSDREQQSPLSTCAVHERSTLHGYQQQQPATSVVATVAAACPVRRCHSTQRPQHVRSSAIRHDDACCCRHCVFDSGTSCATDTSLCDQQCRSHAPDSIALVLIAPAGHYALSSRRQVHTALASDV